MVDTILIIALILFGFSLAVLAASAYHLVGSLSSLMKKLGVSGFIVGSLVLAFGNSLPEFATALVSSATGEAGLGLGVAIGSPFTNLALIIGLVMIINPIKIRKGIETMVLPLTGLPPLLLILAAIDGVFSRYDGLLFLSVFIVYQYYLFKSGFKVGRHVMLKKIYGHYIVTPLAIFALIVASFLLVSTGTFISMSLGVPAVIVGLIIIAFGTSVPDLVVSLTAAMKKEGSLGLGDVIGANMFDFLFIVGVVALLKPVAISFDLFRIPLYLSLIATVGFAAYVLIRKRADRPLGIALLGMYAAYVVALVLTI